MLLCQEAFLLSKTKCAVLKYEIYRFKRLSLKRGFGECGHGFDRCDGLGGLGGLDGSRGFGGFDGLGGFWGFDGFSGFGRFDGFSGFDG